MSYQIIKIESEKHFEEVKSVLIDFKQKLESYLVDFVFLEDSHVYFHNDHYEWCVCPNTSINKNDIEINIDQLRTILTQHK
jgi:hypothetical protein